jgi:Uma2 family endonuclease
MKKTINISPSEYLAFERASDIRHEYLFDTTIEMAGATLEHNRITKNLFLLLGIALDAFPFEILPSDMRVYNPLKNSYFYPDIVVCDGDAITIENDNLINPLLIIEVSSPSTAVFDKTDKFINYRSIETLKEYVLIATDKPLVEIYHKDDNGVWSIETIFGLEKTALFQSINQQINLKDIYKKVLS